MDPVELTRRLVAVESPTGFEGQVVDLLAGILEHAGYRMVRQPVTPGRENIYAWREPPALVFSTHLDCVPPYVPLREDDEWRVDDIYIRPAPKDEDSASGGDDPNPEEGGF